MICRSADSASIFTSATGVHISDKRPARVNFGVYWDGDLLRELLDGTTIDKWNPKT